VANYTPQYNFSKRGFNPLFWHILPLLRDPKIRYIKVEGGSSAAKTYTICQALLIDGFQNEYSSMVFRRQLVDVVDSIYASFKMAMSGLQLDYYEQQQHLFKGKDGKSDVRFRGLEDEENIKGIEKFNVVYFNEFNQFEEHLFDQAKLRLRGRPNQKFICDWNPVSSELWQYKNDIDLQEWDELPLFIEGNEYSQLNPEYSFKRINKAGDTVWIKVTYRDNYWVVGRPNGGGFIDQQTLDNFEKLRTQKPHLYRIYANGERGIMRTGAEFWKQFNEDKHVKPLKYDNETTIHISLDENVNPYVTISAWQIIEKEIRQVYEIPCKNPDNNAPKAAQKLIKWLNQIAYKDVVYIYGDPSADKRSTVDENSRSFYDKFIEGLKTAGFRIVNRVEKSAPEVALSAAFINDIYEYEHAGYSITIGDNCTTSIYDYISAKEDKDGKMLKEKVKDKVTGVTYEPVGHFSDAKRYFICSLLKSEFNKYKSRGKPVWGINA
jgi:PBSX family phage terminase large subunit